MASRKRVLFERASKVIPGWKVAESENKVVAVLSDFHVGSLLGLAPRNFVSADQWHSGLVWLWARWEEFQESLPVKIDLLILNGDLIDGGQRAQKGMEAWDTKPSRQTEALLEVLGPVIDRSEKVLVVPGTDYHEGPMGDALQAFISDLDNAVNPSEGITRWHWPVVIGGLKVSVLHGLSYAPVNRETPLGGELRAAVMSTERRERPDVIIRSHVHYFVHVEHSRMHGFATPGFQLKTAFMNRNSVYKGFPDVGGFWFAVDDESRMVYDSRTMKRVWRVPHDEWIDLG